MTAKKTTNIRMGKGNAPAKTQPVRHDYRTNIIVKFHDDIHLPYKADTKQSMKDYNIGPWESVSKKYPGISIEPLFSNINPDKLKDWIRKAKELDPTYMEGNFFQYFKVTCPMESNSDEIASELSGWSSIKKSHVQRKSVSPAVTYSDDPRAVDNLVDPYQEYLDAAPTGVSAKSVWDASVTGSDGTLIKLIDIEKGWTLNHEDLGLTITNLLWGTIDDASRAHGTSVLGIIGAKDNAIGCVGIAPSSTINVISYNGVTIAEAIMQSINYLGFGDVLLIEAVNEEDSGTVHVPAETTDAEYDAIRLATALGIIVVEAGGDSTSGGKNFDTYTDPGGLYILDPGSTDFRDSGAVIVTAAKSTVQVVSTVNTHVKLTSAPYGERVDCYAWGENITTLSSDSLGATNLYVDNFDGTSGAAAMVAGTILSMQGMVLAEYGYRFSPGQIRELLRNSSYGTQLSRQTGASSYTLLSIYMPDLQKFSANHLNFPPDLYMRDYIGDTGEPHSGSISMSPDIILRNSSVANPNNEYGETSANRDSVSLSDTAKIGTTNYMYFRVLNQGQSAPTNTKVTAFWAAPSTLLTPSLLNYIGEIGFTTAIPTGESLTVSDELTWNPPGPAGHYCFVAVVSCDEDPALDPRTIPDWDWDRYYRYIRENNNVTWRNFEMVTMTKSGTSQDPNQAPEPDEIEDPEEGQNPIEELPKKGWQALDFISPGLPEKDQVMDLEIMSKLPKETTILLQIPHSWRLKIFKGSPFLLKSDRKKVGYFHINPMGTTRLNNILFRKEARVPLRLFINIPDKLKKKNYTIAVRQMLNEKEAGRLTWQLVPPGRGK